MDLSITELLRSSPLYPERLRMIPSSPTRLFQVGAALNELLERPCVAIVGNRNITPYGRRVTSELAAALAEQGVVIISGLALGVDAAAHRAALDVEGLTIAVLPGPLDNIVPHSHRQLAEEIVAKGGTLVSEYTPGEPPVKQNFIARNRIVSGLAQAIVITEAGEKSGSLYTARFALAQQQREILAVPGNIHQQFSKGTNNLIRAGEASAALSYLDVLHALSLYDHATPARLVRGRNQHEQQILDLMLQGVSDGELLYEQSNLSVSGFNQALTMLEISGKIRPLGANHWAIY